MLLLRPSYPGAKPYPCTPFEGTFSASELSLKSNKRSAPPNQEILTPLSKIAMTYPSPQQKHFWNQV